MKTFIIGLLAVLFVLSGCSDAALEEDKITRREDRRTNDAKDNDTPGENLDEALSHLGNALEELGESLNGESGVEPVDYRDLREFLPNRIRGLEKGSYNGERTGTLGFKVSKVEQEYESENGDESVDISIVDLGTLRNFATFGLEWLKLEVDREDDKGFERTTRIDGHPALEKCETTSRYERCEVHLLVDERFVVEIKSKGLSIRQVRNILDDIDLKDLAELE